MMSITQFTMEEVRCFGERQTLEIRPLTFLVGENSTGKTTALGCFHVLADYFQRRGIDFNSHPYSMGTFKDIVRNSNKKVKSYKLGYTYNYEDENIEVTVEFYEKASGFEPIVNSITSNFSDGRIIFEAEAEDEIGRGFRITSMNEEQNHYHIYTSSELLNDYPYIFLYHRLQDESELDSALSNYLKKKSNKSERRGFSPFDTLQDLSIFSTSPVRSRPKRTYDPTREFNDPEGSDVPMYLMRIEATEKKDWEMLKEQLIDFGKSSGLFQNIKINKLGRSLGAPFQLQFKVRGPTSNITDVGYGISQILPILVQILNPNMFQRNRRLRIANFTLLQQPEVHLHPRAQAQFSSLLVNSASRGKQSFIVETHSDYMIDRARIEIRKGNIKPDDVSLIYFEPVRNIVRIHNIGFDEMGNPIDVPKHYREFFLKETDRLMGF
ncbi:AAA family ATPase, partial [Candidatus Poribacteria bacterium]|nr:AAA family ATPase [Candidatus Poribacteria bacterium]